MVEWRLAWGQWECGAEQGLINVLRSIFVFLIKHQCVKSDVGCYMEPLEAALGHPLRQNWDFPVFVTEQNPRLVAPSSPGHLWCLISQPIKKVHSRKAT